MTVSAPIPATARSARRPRIRPGVFLAGVFLLALFIAAVGPGLVTGSSPLAVNLSATLQSPRWGHIFGTDASGRDVYTRVVYGARTSLLIGLGATTFAMTAGVLLGWAAGLGGRFADAAIGRLLEVLFAIPGLLTAMVFVAVFGPGVWIQTIAVALAAAPGYARLARGQILAVRGSGYVEAARTLGHSRLRVTLRHILPNALRPLTVVATLGLGQAVVWAGALSFLGLGVAPPAPEWGAMLNDGRDLVTQAWWLEVFPGLAVVGVALAATALGRHVQQRLDGRAA